MIRSVMSVKGGIGKTSTAIQIATGFARAGKRTLLVDADGQGTSTMLMLPKIDFNADSEESKKSISNVLSGKCDVADAIWDTSIENLEIIPANLDLFSTIYELQSSSINGLPQFKLKKILRDLHYDEIVIDNNPSINMMSVNSIYAADQLIIPTCLDVGGLAGVNMTIQHAVSVVQALDRDAILDYRILFTMVNRNKMEKEIAEQIGKLYGDHIYKQQIHYQAAPFRKSNFENTCLLDDPKANVAREYRDFIAEMLQEERGMNHGRI